MNILLLGGAGFIGTNLTLALAADPGNRITVADRDASYFQPFGEMGIRNVRTVVSALEEEDFDRLLEGQDMERLAQATKQAEDWMSKAPYLCYDIAKELIAAAKEVTNDATGNNR